MRKTHDRSLALEWAGLCYMPGLLAEVAESRLLDFLLLLGPGPGRRWWRRRRRRCGIIL